MKDVVQRRYPFAFAEQQLDRTWIIVSGKDLLSDACRDEEKAWDNALLLMTDKLRPKKVKKPKTNQEIQREVRSEMDSGYLARIAWAIERMEEDQKKITSIHRKLKKVLGLFEKVLSRVARQEEHDE